MKAQQKKLSGCASNLLAHEDLGHLRRPIVGIYKPSSIMKKFPLVYESDKTRDSLSWRSWCYFEAQVWKKDSSIAPFYSFFILFGLFLFGLSLFLLGKCSMNDDHHTSIYLQLNDYNSILEQRWLYVNAFGGVTGYAMNQEWHVWKNYEWWLCHK